jgi:uncharacterized membrane protein YkoI
MNRRWLIGLMTAAALALVAQAQSADDETNAKAARLQQAGEIMSKDDLIKHVHARHSGKVVDTELRREGQGYVYLVHLLDAKGNKQELKFDAKTGDLLTPADGERKK